MKADTFAKLVTFETLIDAEVGFWLEHHPPSADRFREGMVTRLSDLVDQVDALDAVAAARVYDAVVDFLTELPDDGDDDVVETTLRFKRSVERVMERGMDERQLGDPATWAVVLDELLTTLAGEYHAAVRPAGEVRAREYARVRALLARARDAAERMAWLAGSRRGTDLRDPMDRLAFAVGARRLKPSAIDALLREPLRLARRHRPSSLYRIGTYVVGQLLRRGPGETKKP